MPNRTKQKEQKKVQTKFLSHFLAEGGWGGAPFGPTGKKDAILYVKKLH